MVTALALPLVVGGCGFAKPERDPLQAEAALPVWPPAPDEPRVRYLRSVHAPSDWGIERSILRRAFDALVGNVEEAFVRPTGVAERDGVLYVADPGAPALWIVDIAQNRFAKVVQAGKERLLSPVAVAVRPDGAVFVADSALGKVFLVDREGKFVRTVAENGLVRPAGLAYDANEQRLYVADAARHLVELYAVADGTLLAARGQRGSENGEFNFPTHLTLDPEGRLLVTDALNFRVQAFDREGRFAWKLGRAGDGAGDFAAPKGIAADNRGQLFVVDALFDVVQIFDRDAKLLLAFGERGSRPGQFWLPGGIFISTKNEIYVADSYNRRVQVFQALPEPDDKARK